MASISVYRLLIISAITTTTLQVSPFPANTEDFLEKMKKLAEIKTRILSKIGLRDRPFLEKPMSGKPLTGRLFKGRIKNSNNEGYKPRGEYYAEIQEVVSHSQIPENVTDANVIQFKVVRDNQGRKLEVTSADLLVKIKYKRKKRDANGRRRKLKLKRISLKLSDVNADGKPMNLVSSITTKIRRTKWLKVPVPAELIETAMQRNDQILYLHLNCDGCDNAVKLILINGNRRKSRRNRHFKRKKGKGKMRELKTRRTRRKRRLNRTRPFLILHTKVKTYIRSKRSALTCTNDSTCCMENLHVDFSMLGWSDWVIAPRSFETGVCQGACSNSISDCQETKVEHLALLIFDENRNIIFTTLPNMIVTECGCAK